MAQSNINWNLSQIFADLNNYNQMAIKAFEHNQSDPKYNIRGDSFR